ncbi:MAG: phosphoadenylyl-sulfate reductase [Propionibacteriaceae bacterium]
MSACTHPPADTPAAQRTDAELAALAPVWAEQLEPARATEIMAWAVAEFGSELVITSSMADTVMIRLAEQARPGIDVVFLDTGYHFVETIGTRDAVMAVHDVNVINVTPELSVAAQDAAYGTDLFATNPDACCGMRKVEPLGRALAPYRAWASGVRRADSPRRADTPVVTWEPRRRLIKISPIARWSDADVAAYIEANSLLTNPLLEDGYPSIGCAPCTQKAATDDPRSGRWVGLGKTECGIHR